MIKPKLINGSTRNFIMWFTPYCSFLEMIDYWVGNVYFPNKTSEFKPSYVGLSKLECLINDLND